MDDALRSNGLLMAGLGLPPVTAPNVVSRPPTAFGGAWRASDPGAFAGLRRCPSMATTEGRSMTPPSLTGAVMRATKIRRRKPAYHNGSAWSWTFPHFCEALARAWDYSPPAVAAARAYLGGMTRLMVQGCLGQIPELVDGDAPHTPRGCDAQAWGVTEALRVWKLLADRAKSP